MLVTILVALVNNVESLCTPAQIKAEYKAFTEFPASKISKGAAAFAFLGTNVNTEGACTIGQKLALNNKSPITLNDFSGACTTAASNGGWKSDPCCGNSLNQCCTRRDTSFDLYDINSMSNLNCSQDVRVEASLIFLPPEIKVGLCDGSSIQAAIDNEIEIIKSSGCDKALSPDAYVDCLNTKGSYGPLALPSFAAVFGLPNNATKEDVVPLVTSNLLMIPKCVDIKTNAVIQQVTKEVCEGVTACPFSSCGSEGCYYCDSAVNCTMISSDADGVIFDNTTCPTNVMCGKANQAILKATCDNVYECDINCPNCDNATEICTANGVCEGYPVTDVICAVPAVWADCPASCSYNNLMDMCLCKDSSAQVNAKFNVSISTNNFTTPLNAVPNTFCPLGYWELVPPGDADSCHAFKGCFNPQSGSFNSLSTCKDKACTNGVVIKNVYNFRIGNWVKASQKPLTWDVSKVVSTRKWVYSINTDSQFPGKVYTTMVSNMKPDLIAKKMTCLTNMQENVLAFTSCKCGVPDQTCNNMTFLTFTDTHIVVPAGSDKKTVSDNLAFGFISVPPQVSFNDVKFVEARTTFRNSNVPVIVNNSTNSAVGVLFGNGYSFDNSMSGVKLCLNKLPSPVKSPLPSNLGFAKDTGSGPVEMKIPISVNGPSICVQIDVDIDTTYYAMNYELPNPNNPNNNNGNDTNNQPIPSCFGMLANNSMVCTSNGKCVANDTCQCNIGFIGKSCEINNNNNNNGNGTNNQPPPACFGMLANNSMVCTSNGKCIANDTCQCNAGFTGKNCEIAPSCFGLVANNSMVCSGNGKCVAIDTCQCNIGFTGKSCEINNNGNGTNNQPPPACFGMLANNSMVCSGNGKCVANDTCQCNAGFIGKNCEINNNNNNNNGNGTNNQPPPACFGMLANNSMVCSGNGKCVAIDTCQCNAGFIGKSCETNNNNNQNNLFPCFGILSNNSKVCSGNGKCVDVDTCQCNAGFIGKSCETNSNSNSNNTVVTCKGIAASSLSVCSGGGKCVAQDVCQCNGTRYGANCENFVCYSKTVGSCSGNGACVGVNQCSCKTGWAGNECNVCAKGYAGATCSLYVCFGLDQTSKFVCSGNGACTGVDKCSCKSGASGQKCEQYSCGSFENNPCMGHGQCIGPNTCVCNSTQAGGFWAGSNCEICQPNYGGADCKSLACSADVTCLGRGTCNADTTCTCSGNFAGPFCRTCTQGFFGPSCNVTCDPMKKCNGNGFCISSGACSCITNNLLGMYAGESCSSCASGWGGSKCNIKLGSSATFGSVGDRISFEFAFPSLTNNIDCAAILSDSSLKAVGISPICRWDDRSKNSFQIILGAGASLLPGDVIQVKNNDNAFGSVSITGSGSSFLPPSAELRGPKNVSSCTTFLFDASASVSVDRRPLKFSYSISGPGSVSAASASLALAGGSFGYLDASLLSNGEFTMTVTVTNGFNLTAISSFKFTVSSTPSVIVRIPGGASQSMNMGSLYSILPIVEYPSCFFSDRTLIWTWSQESGPATATLTLRDNNRVAIFLENAFPSAGTYSFKVRAVAKASSASFYETTVTLQVIATDLVLMITGGTTRKASITTAFNIDFTRSYDPARDSGSDSFTATCTNLLTNTACSYSMSGVISNKVATFPAGSLPEGEYSIVITYTKGSRSASQELYISMVGYTVLTASVRLTRNDWIPSSIPLGENIPLIVDVLNYVPSPQNPINFTWSSLTDGFTLSEGSTTISKTNGRSLLISGQALSSDTTYSVRVDVSTPNAGGFSVFEFTVNSPPLPGAISASPATSTAGVDTVTVTCSGWYDSNSPLTYQFFFYDITRGIWSTLSGRTTNNQVQAKLPPSPASDKKLKIRARVFDSKNAFSDIETSVISNPPDLTSGTAALNFLNQSANVADSTASSAAAVSSLSSISNQNLAAEVVTQVKAFLVNVITSVLAKQSQVAVSVEDAAETISFISAAVNSLDLVDSNTRGQMLQSTASSLTALANSDKPISSDLANSIASSLSNFIKNILANSGISSRSTLALRSVASDSQSILDSAASLLAGMYKNQLLDQAASISSSSEFVIYTKKISASSTASYSEVISNNTQFELPANFTAGFSSSITSVGINIKQLSNLYKAIYAQSMTIMSKLFELSLENGDTGAKISLNGVKIKLTLSGNFTLGTGSSKYDCLLWNNSTKIFSKDSSCSISLVTSSSATIQVSQSGTYAVSRSISTGTSTVTPTASKSTGGTVITPKTSKSKTISAGATNFITLLAVVISLLSMLLV